jgi:oligosaccharide repeat unit polymerase
MFEALLLVTFIGFVLSNHGRLGTGNPYQIYFFIWLTVYTGYYLTRDLFIRLDNTFVFVTLVSQYFALFLLIISYLKSAGITTANRAPDLKTIIINKWFYYPLFLLVVLGAYPTYLKAIELANGQSIFTIIGFMTLRNSITYEGRDFGIFGYLTPLSMIVAMVSAIGFKNKQVNFLFFLMILLVSLFYCYMATGRTYILMLFCFIFMPFFIAKIFSKKSLIITGLAFVTLFVFIAGMSGKGVSFDNTFSQNVRSFQENIVGYTTAPFVAMSQLFNNFDEPEYGINSLRFFFAVMQKLGVAEVTSVDLVKEYVMTPFPTNVYTVYEVYYRDFLYYGYFIPPLFLLFHFALYRYAVVKGGRWILFYTASTYPLVMMFFQDQYFSLTSQWIQMIFWLFLLSSRSRVGRSQM